MPLPSFRQRRRIAITLTLIALVVMFGIVWIQTGRLADVAILTGGTLLCCVLLLALFGMRRRIPILPLGSVSTWTQVHIYMGFFTAGVYWMHAKPDWEWYFRVHTVDHFPACYGQWFLWLVCLTNLTKTAYRC